MCISSHTHICVYVYMHVYVFVYTFKRLFVYKYALQNIVSPINKSTLANFYKKIILCHFSLFLMKHYIIKTNIIRNDL